MCYPFYKRCFQVNFLSFILLFAVTISATGLLAQPEIDSLERQLNKKITNEERIRIEIDIVNIYLEYNPSKASTYLIRVENHIKESKNTAYLFQLNHAKSINYRQLGNYRLAQKAAEEALSIAEYSKDSLEFKAKIYNSMGAIADDNSDIKLSIEYHLKALRYAESFNNPDLLANVLAGLGRVYMYLSEYDIAINYYKQAISYKEEDLHIDSYLAAYYSNLSSCLDAEQKYDSSIMYLSKSIEINKRLENTIGLITIYNNKAYTLFLIGNLPEASETVKKALFIADSLGEESEAMFPYSTYAEILFAQNKLDQASAMMQKSTELSKKYNDLYLAKYNLDLLYNIYYKKGDFQQALEYYKQKSIVKDTIYSVSSRKDIEKLALEFETEKKNRAIELLNKENEINSIKLKKSNQLVLALLMAAMLSVLVVVLLWLYQKNKVKTNKIIKEAMQRSFEKKLANSELQALRAQMNPHFLFNCLNSINSFIIKNEQELASEYLAKFSKLIRQVLNNSKSSKVTLANELEALELYIEMEALRFNNKFEHSIIIDSNIEKDYVEIPPLIIQPYVENSIWHGLMHKKEGVGTLLVEIKKEDNTLICIIEDNGIGRAAACNLNSKTAVKRKSYGMNITEERLNHINQEFKESANIEVVDLLDDKNTGIGTRVEIKIEVE
jgi:tetratricopeptide (TPR) repeat protein